MDLVLRCPKLAAPDLQRTWLQARLYHHPSLSKLVMEGTHLIYNKANTVFTEAKLAASMVGLAVQADIKLLGKATKTANTEVTVKPSVATTMVTASSNSAEGGVETTDTNAAHIMLVAARP